MTRRRKLVVGLVPVVVVVGVLLRYRVFFDVDAYLAARQKEALAAMTKEHARGAAADVFSRVPDYAALSKYHRGEPPCLTYAPIVSVAEFMNAVDELEAKDLLEDIGDHIYVLSSWQDEDENARHGARSDAELLHPLRENAGLRDRLILSLNRGRLADAVRAQTQAKVEELRPVVQASVERLAPAKRSALREIWSKHKSALAIRSFAAHFGLIKQRITMRKMKRVASDLQQWRREHGEYPVRLQELSDHQSARDDWGATFGYEQLASGAQLISRGADLREGGEGDDQDLVLEVTPETN
jgi:hypothetical protein